MSARAWCVALSWLALLLHPDRAAPENCQNSCRSCPNYWGPPSSVQQPHWPFLAPTVRVSSGVNLPRIGLLNCFNSLLQPCTRPHRFSASSRVVQSRPALAAYHARDLLGDGSCASHNPPCQVEPAAVGKLSRESSPESRPRLLSAAPRRKWKERRSKTKQATKETEGKKGDMTRLSNGEYPFISPNMHRDSTVGIALLAVVPL